MCISYNTKNLQKCVNSVTNNYLKNNLYVILTLDKSYN